MTWWQERRSTPFRPCSAAGLRRGSRPGRGTVLLRADVADVKAALASLDDSAGDSPPAVGSTTEAAPTPAPAAPRTPAPPGHRTRDR